MSALSELIAEYNRDGLSARAISRLAIERGHSLNHDTAARYVRGDHGRPDEATLVALSDTLAIPLGRLRAAAGLPAELTAPYVPPPEASRLTRRQRRAVDEVIRAMLDAGLNAVPASADSPRSAGDAAPAARTRRAARRGRPERSN